MRQSHIEKVHANMYASVHTNSIRALDKPECAFFFLFVFLISQPKHILWVLKRTVSLRRFF